MNSEDGDNVFFVSVKGDNIVVMRHFSEITKTDALNLAAWLVTMADTNDEFGLMLEKVQNA